MVRSETGGVRPSPRRGVLPALLAVLLPACGAAADGEGGAGPATWSVGPEPIVTIGVLDGSPEYVFSRIRGIRLLTDGSIAAADGGSATIRLFGADGSLRRQMGGSGSGPGEFRYLSSIRAAGGDTLHAYDSAAMRLTTYDAGGELLAVRQFARADGSPELYLGRYADGSHALGWIKAAPIIADRLTADSMRIGRFTADGDPAEILSTATGMRRIGSPVPLSPHLLVGMIGDTVILTDGMDGIVRIVRPAGQPVRTLALEGAGWAFERAMAVVESRLNESEIERFQRVAATPGVDFVPDFSDMLIEGGRIWLKLYDPGTDSHWLSRRLDGGEWIVVDPEGRTLARVRMPAGFRPMDVQGDRIAGISRDELDVERVRVYALRRE